MQTQPKPKISKFYLTVVVLLMFVLPLVSVFIECSIGKTQLQLPALAGKWFIFWAIGVRLFSAGLKQVIDPSFTAGSIFHLKDKESFVLVKELGFANICMGVMGIMCVFNPQWRMVTAVGGGLFYGIAGINHIIKKPAGPNEWIALVSDNFIFLLMLGYIISQL